MVQNSTVSDKKLSTLATFSSGTGPTEYVPKIDKVSQDGKAVSFLMSGCWACETSYIETMVYNLESGEMQRIGSVSYFVWKGNGGYEYKEYKEIPCTTPYAGPIPVPCEEDPQNLPLRTGKI